MEEIEKFELKIAELREQIKELEDELKKLRTLKAGDKRAHPRKKVLTLVDYATDKFFSDYAHNISEGGMFIGTRKPLAVGNDATLAFTMPESDIPIKVKAEVVWTGEKGMGLKFKEVDELTKGDIRSVLSETKKYPELSKKLAYNSRQKYSTPRKRKEVHAKVALAMILVFLSAGLTYGIYKTGGIKGIIPSPSLTRIHRENRDKKVETPVETLERATQDEEMKVTEEKTRLEESSDNVAPLIKNKEDTTLDRVGTKDIVVLKKRPVKDIVLLKKGLVKQKNREDIVTGTTNEILVVEKIQPPIPEGAITEEGHSRTLKEANAITDIESHIRGDILKIILTGNGVITRYKVFSLDDPTRLVIDFFKITKIFPQRLTKVNNPYVDRIRIGTHPDKVRLCLDSSKEKLPPHHILLNDNQLVIVMGEVQKSEAKEPAPAENGKAKSESPGVSSYLP